MEPVTHFLTGAALGRSGFNRTTALATVVMTIGAEAADIDALWYFKGSVIGFAHHRGITHTFLGVPFIAALVIAFVWLMRRLWLTVRPPMKRAEMPVRWGLLYFYACIAGLSHLLLDYTNNYGLRPFFPFNTKWYAWDIVFIVEPVMLFMLICGLALPHLFGLINSEIGARQIGPRGRGWAIAALIGIVILWGVRDFEHRRAVKALDSFTYEGHPATRVSAFPQPLNPFRWYGVVETPEFYQSMMVDSLTPEVDPQGRATKYYKSEDTPVSQAAKATYLGRVYMDWARYPTLEVQKREHPDGYDVTFRDVRFLYPDRGPNGLAAYLELDPLLHSVRESFRPPN
ncbi:MAG TPA: metal-dependent hydrolase [candidate division Zixibacteria bacterium]|nr:metal-dependent hydrolase [candidate division Zixibacteria bacterium]